MVKRITDSGIISITELQDNKIKQALVTVIRNETAAINSLVEKCTPDQDEKELKKDVKEILKRAEKLGTMVHKCDISEKE